MNANAIALVVVFVVIICLQLRDDYEINNKKTVFKLSCEHCSAETAVIATPSNWRSLDAECLWCESDLDMYELEEYYHVEDF